MSTLTPRPERLAHAPVLLRDGRWWWVSGPGAFPVTDPTFTSTLNGFSQAMAAADQAVADLHARQSRAATSGARERR
ncbi:hypothetical protein ACGH2B_25040 [Streptomyces sp. BBFR2]|uniref:hypothetical protein n=1 Tax=Streptomyces sp. BBFR2 TaxID=3372854 RepID=UPI0037D9D85E